MSCGVRVEFCLIIGKSLAAAWAHNICVMSLFRLTLRDLPILKKVRFSVLTSTTNWQHKKGREGKGRKKRKGRNFTRLLVLLRVELSARYCGSASREKCKFLEVKRPKNKQHLLISISFCESSCFICFPDGQKERSTTPGQPIWLERNVVSGREICKK